MKVNTVLFTLLSAQDNSTNEVIAKEASRLLDAYFRAIFNLCTDKDDKEAVLDYLSEVRLGTLTCDRGADVYKMFSDLSIKDTSAFKFIICDGYNFDINDLDSAIWEVDMQDDDVVLIVGYCIGYHMFREYCYESCVEGIPSYIDEYGKSNVTFDRVVYNCIKSVFDLAANTEDDENYCRLDISTMIVLFRCVEVAFESYTKRVSE